MYSIITPVKTWNFTVKLVFLYNISHTDNNNIRAIHSRIFENLHTGLDYINKSNRASLGTN